MEGLFYHEDMKDTKITEGMLYNTFSVASVLFVTS